MKRYALKLEAIGDNYTAFRREFGRNIGKVSRAVASQIVAHQLPQAQKLGKERSWVARIVGQDAKYGFVRQFLRAEKDYSEANGTGSRGIFLYYWLEPGVYEINERLSWKQTRRYFAQIVDSETMIELTKDEVTKCL